MRLDIPRMWGGKAGFRQLLFTACFLDSLWPSARGQGGGVWAMSRVRVEELRNDSARMFHHGFDNYMNIAFPADELRPLSCVPYHRDTANPMHIGVNDVLGEFALTAVDSLSALAILAHSSETSRLAFWDTVEKLETYFDSKGGFNIDSTVQVFETTIRVLGGLLSAHLFAIGEFKGVGKPPKDDYDGVLLRLAYDLGQRLLPAFETSDTGIPHPRVNLRYGLRKKQLLQVEKYRYTLEGVGWQKNVFVEPFQASFCPTTITHSTVNPAEDITENCSAGAGTMVLEMTVLSRLTGDGRFEEVAKKAFNAVWIRRTALDLIGGGIDSVTGEWTEFFSGIGAGIDSFYEYAFKSYVLLSVDNQSSVSYPEQFDSDYFLTVYDTAIEAIDRHLRINIPFVHYANVHLSTGAQYTNWIDSLAAYFAGLLANSGAVEDATKLGLLYTALWAKYGALPERWNFREGSVEGGLSWWPGRPELIESVYSLYQATKDPWYLHVGEMIYADVVAGCKTACGWAGIQDVYNGEKSDRMESFMLGETAKYLYLLYDTDHPLQRDGRAWVFSTEGHPLLIPPKYAMKNDTRSSKSWQLGKPRKPHTGFCPFSSKDSTSIYSATASRGDLFHASKFVRLERMQGQALWMFPLTLPWHLVRPDATCDPLPNQEVFDLVFPSTQQQGYDAQTPNISRVQGGVLLRSLSNLRVSLLHASKQYRVSSIGSVPLGVDERIYVPRDALSIVLDPSLSVRWNPYTIKLEFKRAEKPVPQPSLTAADRNWNQDLRQLLHSSLSQLFQPGSDLPPTPSFHTKTSESGLITTVLAPNAREPTDGESYTYLYRISHNACHTPITIPPLLAPYLQLLMIPRGGCTFTEKLANIPSSELPNLAIVLFLDLALDKSKEHELIRPLIDHPTPYTVGMVGGKDLGDVDEVLEIVAWRMKGTVQVGGVDVINWEVV